MFIFRWRPETTDEQKARVIPAVRALQGQIPGLLETWVGTNVSVKTPDYAIGGAMKFVDQAAYEAYGPHPVHQALLEWLMPLIEAVEADFQP
ncbi:MAG TPA: Dabb family protein [Granulicella sp.]